MNLSTEQVAKQVGIGRATLERWLASGKLKPPKTIRLGRSEFRGWTAADVERVRKFKGTLKPGPQTRSKKKK
jgi:excisionase family DNA binding protein